MTDSPEDTTSPAAAAIARSRAKRAGQAQTVSTSPKPARGGKYLASGAAVGLSLVAVGAMSAAAQNTTAPDSVPQLVVPETVPAPPQIVIVLPGGNYPTLPVQVIEVPATEIAPQRVEVTTPTKPNPPTLETTEKAPITESGGS